MRGKKKFKSLGRDPNFFEPEVKALELKNDLKYNDQLTDEHFIELR